MNALLAVLAADWPLLIPVALMVAFLAYVALFEDRRNRRPGFTRATPPPVTPRRLIPPGAIPDPAWQEFLAEHHLEKSS